MAYREPGTAAAARRRLRPRSRTVRTYRLVPHDNARQTVVELIDAVKMIGEGVLHVTGWTEAFGGSDLAERLYALNFLRESVVEHPATQVWWMPVAFRDAFMALATDSWSVVKLRFRLEDESEYADLTDRIAGVVRHWLDLDALSPIPTKAMGWFHKFYIYEERLSREDIRSISRMSNLVQLDLSEAQVEDFAPLVNLVQLEKLGLFEADAKDYAPLGGLKSLVALNLTQSDISNVEAFSRLENLRYLDLSNTSVKDVSPLARLPKLASLDISGTKVKDVSVLSGLRCLMTLNVSSLRLPRSQVDHLQANLPHCLILDWR